MLAEGADASSEFAVELEIGWILEHLDDTLSDDATGCLIESTGRDRRCPDANARGIEWLTGVEGDHVLVGRDADRFEELLCLLARESY